MTDWKSRIGDMMLRRNREDMSIIISVAVYRVEDQER